MASDDTLGPCGARERTRVASCQQAPQLRTCVSSSQERAAVAQSSLAGLSLPKITPQVTPTPQHCWWPDSEREKVRAWDQIAQQALELFLVFVLEVAAFIVSFPADPSVPRISGLFFRKSLCSSLQVSQAHPATVLESLLPVSPLLLSSHWLRR